MRKAGLLRGNERIHNAKRYEYPVDDYGQIYIPLKPKQIATEVHEEEKIKEIKN